MRPATAISGSADKRARRSIRSFERLPILAASLVASLALLGAIAIPASAAAPWWQVLTGSRPTHIWTPSDNVQELVSTRGDFFGLEEFAVAKIEVGGTVVGCLANATFFGTALCEGEIGFPPDETAPQLEATLESAFATTSVEVTGGPTGDNPFRVTVPQSGAPTIELTPLVGTAKSTLISRGGSGRLVLTLTNLGDATVDATGNPVQIVDELPAGLIATGVEAVAGGEDTSGPVDCKLKGTTEVACSFGNVLPAYESIEVEIYASLVDASAAENSMGHVAVSGGNAPSVDVQQHVEVSGEPSRFGIEQFSAEAEDLGGSAAIQAGGHPFQFTTTLGFNSGPVTGVNRRESTVEQPALPRGIRFPLPAGLLGNPSLLPQCPMSTFLHITELINACPADSAIGASAVTVIEHLSLGLVRWAVPVFNLPAGDGEPARFGFVAAGVPVVIDTSVDPTNDYKITASVRNITQTAQILGATTTFWGTPGDPRHDESRGWGCLYFNKEVVDPCARPAGLGESAFLRMPVQCVDPLAFEAVAESWNAANGVAVDQRSAISAPLVGCNRVPFDPAIAASPTTKLAENPSGLDFKLTMPNSGLNANGAIAEGQPEKVEVDLPPGVTINPSAGEGLAVCTAQQYGRETADSEPGAGCPQASKIGNVKIATPLLQEDAIGALYQAAPFENPSHSLLGLYLVARIPDRGILVKQAGKVEPDPQTGQLVTTFGDLPQLPFSSFELHFREGGRAPLVTPPRCGAFQTEARFTPSSASDPDNPAPNEIVTRTASFTIERGVDGGPCPIGGLPPFKPNLLAGTRNNAAGSFSPFDLRLTRTDGEQEFTHFSIKLPPGVVGKLAGIPFCPDSAIAAAKARTGPTGGAEELASPSCPAASEVGHTLVGAGVGSILTYVPGKVYLAGPYHGSPLSIAAITAAKVGPFDLGAVVVREALRINPETAEVFVDAAGSDPIPHIIQGIPVHARDIRVSVDRSQFVLNPTSCERTSTASTVLGSGLDFSSEADDNPLTVTSPFQAADCASLGFKPRLSLRLKGESRRGGNPALRAVLRPRVGDANATRISVALPHSEFLDQGHIRTVCTRVQFKAGAGNGAMCPSGSIYGHARAWTPLFSEPLEGPIFLRSSEHPLPDLVLALHGLIDVDAVGRIDSVNGGIRNTFDFVPDAPISKVVVDFPGGKKSLLENSTNVCSGNHRAVVKMEGHNGRLHNFSTPLKASCGKAGNHPRSRRG
jgi:hypothetical protein